MIRALKALLLSLCLWVSVADVAFSAHTYDTKGQTSSWATSNPTDLSYTCGTGSTLLVLMIQHTQTARTGGAPTYNSVAMTQANSEVLNAQEVGVEIWYMQNPPTGSSYTIRVPNSGSGSMRITAATFKAQSGYTSRLFNTASDNVDKQNTTLTINSVPAASVCLDVLGHGYLNPPSARSHTLLYTNDEGALTFETQYGLIGSSGNVTMTHTVGGSDDVANLMACFEEQVVTNETINLSGQGSTASAGSLSVVASVDGTATLSGTAGTSGHGDLTVTAAAPATAELSGSAGTSVAGDLVVSAAADAEAVLSGTAGTSGSGSLAVSGDAALALSGSESTAGIGSLTVSGNTAIDLSGSAAAAEHGNLLVSGAALAALTGSAGTANHGTLTVSAAGVGDAVLSGTGTTAGAGDLAVSVQADGTATLSGQGTTAGHGTLGVTENVIVSLSGSAGTANHGVLSVSGSATIGLSGTAVIASAGGIGISGAGGFVPGREKTKKIEIKGFKYLR